MITKLLNKFGYFTEKQVLLSFEFALQLSDVIVQEKIALDREKVMEIEKVLISELSAQSEEKFAYTMPFLMLAALENKQEN